MASNQELLESGLKQRSFDETVYQFLTRRERELLNQIAAEKAATATKEIELAHVQSAKRTIGNLGAADKVKFGAPETLGATLAALGHSMRNGKIDETEPAPIKQLILKAMWASFRETGATSSDLRQFIADAYGRNIHPSSMSPQISRLKNEMLLKQKENEIWRLTKLGIARCAEEWGYSQKADDAPLEQQQE